MSIPALMHRGTGAELLGAPGVLSHAAVRGASQISLGAQGKRSLSSPTSQVFPSPKMLLPQIPCFAGLSPLLCCPNTHLPRHLYHKSLGIPKRGSLLRSPGATQ